MRWTYYSVRIHDQVILHPKPAKLDGGLLANGITDMSCIGLAMCRKYITTRLSVLKATSGGDYRLD